MKRVKISNWFRHAFARAIYFFVLTVPEVIFATDAAPIVSGGETKLLWWVVALIVIMLLGSVGIVSSVRGDITTENTQEITADSFTIIEEKEQ